MKLLEFVAPFLLFTCYEVYASAENTQSGVEKSLDSIAHSFWPADFHIAKVPADYDFHVVPTRMMDEETYKELIRHFDKIWQGVYKLHVN